MELVSGVDNIEVVIERDGRISLLIRACGYTRRRLWKETALVRRAGAEAPQDGMVELDFLLEPAEDEAPPEPANACEIDAANGADIDAEIALDIRDLENFWGERLPLAGVRVHAACGSHAVLLMGPPGES